MTSRARCEAMTSGAAGVGGPPACRPKGAGRAVSRRITAGHQPCGVNVEERLLEVTRLGAVTPWQYFGPSVRRRTAGHPSLAAEAGPVAPRYHFRVE